MPAYSTWQPTEGKIQIVASAVQSAKRRLVDPRGDLMRGNPIASTLLGVCGGPSDPFHEGGNTAVGESIPGPARPSSPSKGLFAIASITFMPTANRLHFDERA